MSEYVHFIDGDTECSCNPLVLRVEADGSISRVSGGPLEEPIEAAAPPDEERNR